MQGGKGKVSVRDLLGETYIGREYIHINQQFLFSADEILDDEIRTDQDIETKYSHIAESFFKARDAALQNSKYYLSMVKDLDVYVATSMRNRQDFRDMADTCDKIFSR